MQDNNSEKIFSLAEIAPKYGVSQDYLRFLIFKKKLRGQKIGRNWVTTKTWMDEFFSTRKTQLLQSTRSEGRTERDGASLQGFLSREKPGSFGLRTLEEQQIPEKDHWDKILLDAKSFQSPHWLSNYLIPKNIFAGISIFIFFAFLIFFKSTEPLKITMPSFRDLGQKMDRAVNNSANILSSIKDFDYKKYFSKLESFIASAEDNIKTFYQKILVRRTTEPPSANTPQDQKDKPSTLMTRNDVPEKPPESPVAASEISPPLGETSRSSTSDVKSPKTSDVFPRDVEEGGIISSILLRLSSLESRISSNLLGSVSYLTQNDLNKINSDILTLVNEKINSALLGIESRIPPISPNPIVFITQSAPSPYRNEPAQQVSGVTAGFGSFSQGIGTAGDLTASGNVSLGSEGKTVSFTSKNWNITSAGLVSGLSGITSTGTTSLESLSVSSSGTSTFSGGISSGGLASSNGLTLTSGSLLNTSSASSSFSNGINLSGGCFSVGGTCVSGGGIVSGGLLTISGAGTSTLTGLSTTGLASSNGFTISGGSLLATNINSIFGSTTLTNLTVSNTSTSTFAGGLTIGTNQFVVQQSSGNVGVGTTSPTQLLSVSSSSGNSAYFAGNVGIGISAPTAALDLRASGNQMLNIYRSTNIAAASIGTTANHPELTLYKSDGTTIGTLISSANNSYINGSGGNVGIGTTTPEAKLNVSVAQAGFYAAVITNSTASTPFGIKINYSAAAPNGSGNEFILAADSGVNRFVVASNGNVTNTNNSYGAISDIRLKENIADASNYLDLLNQVQIKKYSLISDHLDHANNVGVIAQELEFIFPDLVTTGSDGYKSVAYSKFTPMLIRAIQELNLNLEGIAGTITPLAGSADESFVTAFFNNVYAKLKTWLADAGNGIAKIFVGEVYVNRLCIKKSDGNNVCVTGDQLDALLVGAGTPPPPTTPPPPPSPSPTPPPDTTPPLLEVIGNNPAIISAGSIYSDMGVTVTDNVDQNLGYTASLNGGPQLSQGNGLSLDTSTSTSYTILYTATDQAGNVGTTTREVIVQ